MLIHINTNHVLGRRVAAGVGGLLAAAGAVWAQTDDTPAAVTLPEYAVVSAHVANTAPAGTMAAPVSALRYEPQVEVQARNLAEMQADVTIRGGIFENTGFRLGAMPLADPQTGHYFAEIPVAPQMLTAPKVVTGAAGALEGFNANTGTVTYGWRPIETRGEAEVGAGSYELNKESFYQGAVAPKPAGGHQVAADAEWAHADTNGSVPYGDSAFTRAGARVQVRDAATQTDFFAGYQHKFFGWPDLYTPYGVNESENLQTVLLALNTRWQGAGGNWAEAGVYYRRNKDDYEFNRLIPGLYNPYQHTTWVRGVSLTGRAVADEWTVDYTAHALHDDLTSTSLVYGPYRNRDGLKLALTPGREFRFPGGLLSVRAGAAYDYSNRLGSTGSPLTHIDWRTAAGWDLYAEYSGSTQTPTYTALKSSPASGLFRGNQNLGLERSRNAEVGMSGQRDGWQLSGAFFHREDRGLVDWTYQQGVTARTANPVDIDTTGVELLASRRTAHTEIVAGYTWLEKAATYGTPGADASFYALNFPRHRLTLALIGRIGGGVEVRMDNEYRVQEPNLLRTVGGDHSWRSALSLHYLPPALRGWEFSVQADNLWNSDYQDVPSVLAARRQVTAEVTHRW